MKIKNWKNKYVNIIESKGGVIALKDPLLMR